MVEWKIWGLTLLACAATSGCGSSGIAGTYHSESGLHQIILKGNGTFRMLNGERTSPADLAGTYKKVDGSLVFTVKSANSSLPEAKIIADGFTIGQERYLKN